MVLEKNLPAITKGHSPVHVQELFQGLEELPAKMHIVFNAKHNACGAVYKDIDGPMFTAHAEGAFGKINIALHKNLKTGKDGIIFYWAPPGQDVEGTNVIHKPFGNMTITQDVKGINITQDIGDEDSTVIWCSISDCVSSPGKPDFWAHGIGGIAWDNKEKAEATFEALKTLLIPKLKFQGYDPELLTKNDGQESKIQDQMTELGLGKPEDELEDLKRRSIGTKAKAAPRYENLPQTHPPKLAKV